MKFLFSTNSRLSFLIGEQFYQGRHFVWCSPHFEYSAQIGLNVTTPPTSTPKDIYQGLALEVARGDRHSAKIQQNKKGILKGAGIHLASGLISQSQFEDIRYIVSSAEAQEFRPLLYVINYEAVKVDLVEVPIKRRAHPLSMEYQIVNLKLDKFEILELPYMRV